MLHILKDLQGYLDHPGALEKTKLVLHLWTMGKDLSHSTLPGVLFH